MKKVIMKRVVVILFLVLLVPNGNLFLQELPDCWCIPRYYPPNEEYFNEHFYYDTCGAVYTSYSCDSSYWLNLNRTFDGRNRIYAKREWVLWFDVKAFPLPYYPPDTIIEVSWRDVDSINYTEIKDNLKKIEIEYGNYIMKKIAPELNQPGIGQAFRIFFDNYVNGVELENKFNTILFAKCSFHPHVWEINNVSEYTELDYSTIHIYPNPANEYIEINFERCPTSARCRTSGIIEIYNVLGEKVKSPIPNTLNPNPKFRVDVSDLPDGVYFVRFGEFVGRFLKY